MGFGHDETGLSAGWHLVEGNLPEGISGAVRARVSVVDVSGSTHDIPLGELRQDAPIEVVVMIPPGVRQIVIVGSSPAQPAPMKLPGLQLHALSRASAMRYMVHSIATRAGRTYSLSGLSALPRLMAPLVLGRVREAGQRVFARYQADLRLGEGEPGAGCQLGTHRLRRKLDARWQPVNQLRPCASASDGAEWEAYGDDPQFRLEHEGRARSLPAGWYQFDLDVTITAGRMRSPALYPDYGDGCSPQDMINLAGPDANGRIRALVLFKAPVSSLRFDPSIRRLQFAMRQSRLRRIGRIGALRRMLNGLHQHDGSRDRVGMITLLWSFARDAMSGGLSTAAARLYGADAQSTPNELNYPAWVRLYDTLTKDDRQLLEVRAQELAGRPLISVLLPVFQTPERWLRRCLDSVLAQAYGNWELCVVDDASPSAHVLDILEEYARRDPRIRVMRRSENGHIAIASNSALEMAKGSHFALLDHDDELRPDALLEMVEAIDKHPGVGLVYSDEDKIDEAGQRFHPYFKPDWNPDLLLSQNYLCHLTVVDTALARSVGGFRAGYEGSQDHDLFLRCAAQLESTRIHHVPKVLYHWRAISGSTALERGAKDYAAAAGVRAVEDHLRRTAPGARVEELGHGHYRVHWPLPAVLPKVSIIVPTRDRADLLRTCVESVLEKTHYANFEILVVDNQTSEPDALAYLDDLRGMERIRVLAFDAPFNYSAINNWAVAQAAGEVVCLLNNDIEVISGPWLDELVSQAVRPGTGAVGAMLYYPDRTIQHAGVILGLGGVANHIYAGQPAGHPGHGARALVAQNLSAITGACLVTTRAVYQSVGGLDECLQVAFNDIDFCLRLREAGYRNVWTPFAELIHHESASRGRDEFGEKRERFLGEVRYMQSRWGDWLNCDPAYNPNLSLGDINASLAFPPRPRGGSQA